jgi:N-acetylhexosamine 1-kinase
VVTPEEAARHFPAIGSVTGAAPLSGGHIHRSWRVDSSTGAWLVQECRTDVFPDLDALMGNVTALCTAAFPELTPVATHDGNTLWGAWRARPYLTDTVSAGRPSSPAEVRELGRGLGAFHRRVAGMDPAGLSIHTPGFHDPAARLRALDAHPRGEPESTRIDNLRSLAPQLDGLPTRVAHFDAKAENFLLDSTTRRTRALIDLDTVMPGSWLWDVGDLARSTTGTAAEDEPDHMTFDPARWEALVDGYQEEAGACLTGDEQARLPIAPLVVTFEQAVRFLTDHLAGDIYYRVDRRGHNLDRCRAQLALVESMAARQ